MHTPQCTLHRIMFRMVGGVLSVWWSHRAVTDTIVEYAGCVHDACQWCGLVYTIGCILYSGMCRSVACGVSGALCGQWPVRRACYAVALAWYVYVVISLGLCGTHGHTDDTFEHACVLAVSCRLLVAVHALVEIKPERVSG